MRNFDGNRNSFEKLPVPLPPQFLALAYYERDRRYLAIWYDGGKPRLFDGVISQTFPYYQAFAPLVRHPAMEFYLECAGACLGADDQTAVHALLLDTEEKSLYLGALDQVTDFLKCQMPQTDEEIKKAERDAREFLSKAAKAKSMKDLQRLGMFQFFAPAEDRSDEVSRMTSYLDSYIPEEILRLMKNSPQ